VVCLEGHETCAVKANAVTLEDIDFVRDGRIVFGQVDGSPAGTWTTTQLATKLRCKVPGAKAQQFQVKKTQDTAFIEPDAAGRLVTTSTTEGSRPTTLVRIAPGLFGAYDSYKQGKNKVEITTYLGMVSDDEARGTSTMRYTTRMNGDKATCSSDRNYDMVRLGPPPAIEIEDGATAGEGPGDTGVGEAETSTGSDEPGMVFDEDEVEAATE
jgi:hypothetical protein